METNCLEPEDSRYPANLKFCLDNDAPKSITAGGNLAVLRSKILALFCSTKCPGNLILQTYDLAQKLRENAEPLADRERTEKLARHLFTIEQAKSVRELTAVLALDASAGIDAPRDA